MAITVTKENTTPEQEQWRGTCRHCGADKPAAPGWVVQLEHGVWLASYIGDPGRTLQEENAKRFKSAHAGEFALRQARRWRPFAGAFVYQPKGKVSSHHG